MNSSRRQRPRLTLLAACLAGGLALVACSGDSPTAPPPPRVEGEVAGPHVPVLTSRSVQGVRGVVLDMMADLRIEQGSNETLQMLVDPVLTPYLRTPVREGILEIWSDLNLPASVRPPGQQIEFVLTVPSLESVELADTGTIHGPGLDLERLALRLSGLGQMSFPDLTATELDVTISGFGSAQVSGRVDRQDVQLPGTGDYQAADLDSREARVRISGSGSATVRVRERLVATVSGTGSVYYYGRPVVEEAVTGSGSVIPMDE